MGQIIWGDSYILQNPQIVTGDKEISAQHYCYVVNKQTNSAVSVPHATWEAMLNGDMSAIRDSIETQIPGSETRTIRISWDRADYNRFIYYGNDQSYYIVSGFQVEALVFNKNAGLTGFEIIGVILAIAALVAVITFCVLGAWIIYEILTAAKQLGPAITIGVALLLLGGMGVIAFVALGGRFQYKGKKRRISLGAQRRQSR